MPSPLPCADMRVLIVCHAGAGIGLGHLSRSLAIARAALREQYAQIRFLIQGDSIAHPELLRFEHHFWPVAGDLGERIRCQVNQSAPQFVIFDLFPGLVPADMSGLLQDLRSAGCKTIAVDGLLAYRACLDLIFMPSFRCPPAAQPEEGVPVLFGWDCFLLNVRGLAKPWQHGNRVLVLTGGGDVTRLGQRLPTLLSNALPDGAVVDWVTGPYAEQPVRPESAKVAFVNHQAPARLDSLMAEAHYAMTVYGVSFFELLYYGVPTVVFSPYGNKDTEELDMVAAEGVAWVAEDEYDAVASLRALMANHQAAETLSAKARRHMAGADGRRFIQALIGLLA